MTDRSYFDHAASSPMVPEAIAAMTAEMGRTGNASSSHGAGRRARAALEDARESLAADLDCHPSEVVFTSGGTEADNIAVQGAFLARPEGTIARRDRLVLSSIEHPAVAQTMDALARRGADAYRLGVRPDGRVDLDDLRAALDVPTMLVSIMATNNETGVQQDVRAIADAAHAADAWVHSDAVQALGHRRVSFRDWDLDLMSVTGHKVGGPVGMGALVVRRGLPVRAHAYGGGQERDIRSGTGAPALAASFAAAVRRAVGNLDAELARWAAQRARILATVAVIGETTVNAGADSAPHILNVSFAGARADDILLVLDAAGIEASSGSACSAGVHRPSEVLLALGVPDELAAGSVRFSLGWSTTDADVDRLVAALPEAITRARAAF